MHVCLTLEIRSFKKNRHAIPKHMLNIYVSLPQVCSPSILLINHHLYAVIPRAEAG